MLETVRDGIEEEVEEPMPVAPKPKIAESAEGEDKPSRKRGRRKLQSEENVVERPLFPFFEQTLFDTTTITQKPEENVD